METTSIGARIRVARKNRQWTQVTLAKRAGIVAFRISHLETDRRPPSEDEWARLKPLLGLGSYPAVAAIGVPFPLGNWKAGPPLVTRPQKRHLGAHRFAASRSFGPVVDETAARVATRDDAAICEKFMHQSSLDSGHEYFFWLRLLAEGAHPCWYSPAKAGFRTMQVVDRESLINVSCLRHPCLELNHGTHSFLLFPQLSIDARKTYFRLDALVCLSRGRDRYWLDLEIDGPNHDREYDLRRQSLLRLTTIRLNKFDLADLKMLERLDRSLLALLDCG